MQKKLIALAVAGMVAAPLAMAQSNVTLYGIADVGFTNEGSSVLANTKSVNKMDAGQMSASRIGFRGTEDLGNGLRAGFVYELGVAPDEGNVTTTNVRQSTLSLSGNFGTFQMGRQLTPQNTLLGMVDPFATTGIGNINRLYAANNRLDNLFAYVSPNMNGFTVIAGYTWNGLAAENAGNESVDGDARVWAISPRYSNGPITAGLNYHRVDLRTTGPESYKNNVWDVVGAYDFGAARVSAAYGQRKGSSDLKNDTGVSKMSHWMLAVSAPVSEAGTLMASYTDAKISTVAGLSDPKAKQFALGYSHKLSSRTNIYTKYAKINYNGAGKDAFRAGLDYTDFALGSDTSSFPTYRSGFTVGLRHVF